MPPMPSRPPAPPSFYGNVAQMSGGSPGGQPGQPGQQPGQGKKAGEDEIEIVKTLFRVFEKWRKAAGGDQKKSDLIQKMADVLEQYNNEFVKTDLKSGAGEEAGATKPPQPTPGEGQGPTPAAAGGGAGMETQPVPA
jgi:hypothetical protein